MKVLVITNLYPLPWEPNRATFNRQQLEVLGIENDVNVLIPVPWPLWFRNRKLLEARKHKGIAINYSNYLYIPRVLRSTYGITLALSLLSRWRFIKRLNPDILILSWGYPDAVAVSLLNLLLKIPAVVKVHGSDINVHAGFLLRRIQIRWAMARAYSVIAVSQDLGRKVARLGISPEKVRVIYNGVDKSLFRPIDRLSSRKRLKLDGGNDIILYVGNLKLEKGCLDLLEAFHRVAERNNNARLIYIGSGPQLNEIKNKIRDLDLSARVRLVGSIAHKELPDWMSAVDLVVLASHNEGVPNVLLEAMSCGKPVVATRVGGIPEVVPSYCGFLVEVGDQEGLADAMDQALKQNWDSRKIVESTAVYTWESNLEQIKACLKDAVISGERTG